MARYSSGRFALRISDRDGFAYPYNEMVQEWTGAWVHRSEYEPKSPLLNPTNQPDPYDLQTFLRDIGAYNKKDQRNITLSKFQKRKIKTKIKLFNIKNKYLQ